jgi:hypothetical protein
MTSTQTFSPLELHLTKISRGGTFFRTLHSLTLLALIAAVYRELTEFWPLYHGFDGVGEAVAFFGGFAFVLVLKTFPLILLALGFRHLGNLFKAVRGALEDLRATI